MLQFAPNIVEERKPTLMMRIEEYKARYDHLLSKVVTELPFDTTLQPNWACHWNKPKRIYETCKLIASDGRWCIVEFADGMDVYRTEDIDVLKVKLAGTRVSVRASLEGRPV